MGDIMKYLANAAFACGSHTYRAGDEVPVNLQNNDERLKRGLIREVKTVIPTEQKAVKNVNRESKNKTKQSK